MSIWQGSNYHFFFLKNCLPYLALKTTKNDKSVFKIVFNFYLINETSLWVQSNIYLYRKTHPHAHMCVYIYIVTAIGHGRVKM